jgi:hypothetical protein
MTDVEELVRRSLARHVAQAPAGDGLPAKVRRRRRRGAIASSLATVIVVAVAGTAVALDISNPRTSTLLDVVSGPPTRVVAFHGIDLTVPASWRTNDSSCGNPLGNTVIVPALVSVQHCRIVIGRAGRFSDAVLTAGSVPSVKSRHWVIRNGLTQIVGSTTDATGVVSTSVAVPSAGALITINTVDPGVAHRIVDSIRPTSVSPEGCAMRNPSIGLRLVANGRPPQRSGAALYLIPPGPSSIALCEYVQGWLEGSTTVHGIDAARLANQVRAAPSGFRISPGINCVQPLGGFGIDAVAHYPRGHSITVEIADDCGATIASNGTRGATLGRRMVKAFAGPLHSDF